MIVAPVRRLFCRWRNSVGLPLKYGERHGTQGFKIIPLTLWRVSRSHPGVCAEAPPADEVDYTDHSTLTTPSDPATDADAAGFAISGKGLHIGGMRHEFRDVPGGFRAPVRRVSPYDPPAHPLRAPLALSHRVLQLGGVRLRRQALNAPRAWANVRSPPRTWAMVSEYRTPAQCAVENEDADALARSSRLIFDEPGSRDALRTRRGRPVCRPDMSVPYGVNGRSRPSTRESRPTLQPAS
ncbi:hypothetical protein HEK131_30640 [Streptomyces seoulensis]|nr:hypothetical protein HEK131_30640 [Streptomyces seoulensis]